jgi:hypothetical protein
MEKKEKRFKINWFWGLIGLDRDIGFYTERALVLCIFLVFSVLRGTHCQEVQSSEVTAGLNKG